MMDDIDAGLIRALRAVVREEVVNELGRRRLGPEWLTLAEAAERYRTTPDALRQRARRGRLPGAVRDGSRWLVDAAALDAALTDRSVPRR